NYWMHNGFLQVEGEKMSKSLGNFVTIRQLLTEWNELPRPGDAIRFSMLMTQYTQPLDWTLERLVTAAASLHRFNTVGVQALGLAQDADITAVSEISSGLPSAGLLECLTDDLNTPAAISYLFSLAKRVDQKGEERERIAQQLLTDCLFLNIDPFRYLREEQAAYKAHHKIEDAPILELIEARNAARKLRDFKEADRIRDQLKGMGVELEDRRDGTTLWRRVK